MKKTRLMTSILALSMIPIMVTGCGGSTTKTTKTETTDNNQKAEITWWDYPNFTSGTAGDYEKKIVENFNKKYPNIKVNIEMIDFASDTKDQYCNCIKFSTRFSFRLSRKNN